jgi:fructokinase
MQQKRQVYTIGESLYDIIFKEGKPIAGKPGGSMLNTSVSLGRCGLPVSLISEIADDAIGRLIEEFLKENHVGSDYLYFYEQGATALAIATLDSSNNASYRFYKDYPVERLQTATLNPGAGDILLYGSSYALYPELTDKIIQIAGKAERNNSIIVYDPNFRPAVGKDIPDFRDRMLRHFSLADIIRCSAEDLKHAFSCTDAEAFYCQHCKPGQVLICTQAEKEVRLFSPGFSRQYKIPEIIPVSTIGAGDNFNAGIIYSLMRRNLVKNDLLTLHAADWDQIVATGIAFATEVCLSYDNYISWEFADDKNEKK